MEGEIELRACCGRLRFALLDAVESLPEGAHISGLRWGPTEVPLNLATGSAPEVVDEILAAAERWLGSSTACYTGRGVLVFGSELPAGSR